MTTRAATNTGAVTVSYGKFKQTFGILHHDALSTATGFAMVAY